MCDDIRSEILQLKETHNAIILAHNYVTHDIQDIADFVGDSLELSRKAQNNQAETIVFCGVRFMAETAKILSPHARVLMPNPNAGCPMADMCSPEALRTYRESHPDHLIIAYVNTTAATKALVDICCTSGNAENLIRRLPPEQPKMFLPDKNLGANLNKKLGISMALWEGCCHVHHGLSLDALHRAKAAHPEAEIIVHLECRPEIVDFADAALSTSGMLVYVANSSAKIFIIGTEEGMLHRLRKEHPDRTFIPVAPALSCRDMKMVTLQNVRDCLKYGTGEVTLSQDILIDALRPIERMLALS